jgi:hypothetical protein
VRVDDQRVSVIRCSLVLPWLGVHAREQCVSERRAAPGVLGDCASGSCRAGAPRSDARRPVGFSRVRIGFGSREQGAGPHWALCKGAGGAKPHRRHPSCGGILLHVLGVSEQLHPAERSGAAIGNYGVSVSCYHACRARPSASGGSRRRGDRTPFFGPPVMRVLVAFPFSSDERMRRGFRSSRIGGVGSGCTRGAKSSSSSCAS